MVYELFALYLDEGADELRAREPAAKPQKYHEFG